MAETHPTFVVEQLIAVIKEAFEGAGSSSYFTDHGADAGWLGTLSKVSAEEASRAVGGTSIAAHVHHLIFSLDASSAWIRGDQSRRNWADSWRVRTVDSATWSRMLTDVGAGYETLCRTIESNAMLNDDAFSGAVGAVAHVAYHLGAVRQKAAQLTR